MLLTKNKTDFSKRRKHKTRTAAKEMTLSHLNPAPHELRQEYKQKGSLSHSLNEA